MKKHFRKMSLKLWFKVVGLLLLVIGLMFLPAGFGVTPKRDLSVFFNLADLGVFLRVKCYSSHLIIMYVFVIIKHF